MRHVVMSILILGVLCARLLSAQQGVSTDELSREMATLLRWRAFWEGTDSFRNYVPGRKVKAAVVQAPGEIAVFVSDVGVAMFLQTAGRKISRANIQAMGDETNTSAVSGYIANFGGMPGFVLKPGASVDTSKFPVRQDSMSEKQKRELLKQESLWFTLPELSPPGYIVSRRTPPDLPRLESAVRSRVGGFYNPSCGRGEVLIPYFSPTDPAIYVYADLGACGRGIFSFVREESGEWRSGQFSPDKPPNQWSKTIQQIQENPVRTIRLPAGSQ
jgi:hypothetical protein